MKQQKEYKKLDSPKTPEPKKSPRISIFIKNEVHQDGQHQDHKQDHKQDSKDESQNGCTAFFKRLFTC